MTHAVDLTMFDDLPEGKRKGDWLSFGVLAMPNARHYLQPDVDVRLVLRVGSTSETWVGRIMAVTKARFAFAAWGQRDSRVLRFANVERAGLVLAHSWAERHEVMARQRRGLPARVSE